MIIEKRLLTPNKYSRPQIPLNKVTKIAVHYVGNAGSTAIGNRNYFESLKNGSTYASSHYIIGLQGEIIQCIPENEISYCTNSANSYSISIENCHPKADGEFTQATRKSLIALCADICKRYGLDPQRDIIRHYDVTGKPCPLYWVNYPHDFTKFKNEVADLLKGGDNEMITPINIRVNGKDIKADAIIKNDETYIKLRSFENAGFTVGYDKDMKLRTIDNTIKIKLVSINGKESGIEGINLYGYNFVNLRPMLKLLGFEVEYNPYSKSIQIKGGE